MQKAVIRVTREDTLNRTEQDSQKVTRNVAVPIRHVAGKSLEGQHAVVIFHKYGLGRRLSTRR